MLKRKIFRMSFFCQGIYLIVAASNGGNLKLHFNYTVPFSEISDTTEMVIAGPKVQLTAKAEKFANTYIKNNTEALLKAKERSLHCFDMMDSVFNNYGLPTELKYLAVVESELKPNALSHVGAVGPWQLMPATARIMGLKVSRKYDERKYFKKSTVAAARYIKDLYGEFGDWLLVLAAYNGGPGPVHKAIRRSGSYNFWKLQNFLPAETRDHVKRFISTHYFFEGNGSVTTLTKYEMNKYLKTLEAFKVKNHVNAAIEKSNFFTDSILNNSIATNTSKEVVMGKPRLK
jgi:membrane-bound lytic murein transglycosylase D